MWSGLFFRLQSALGPIARRRFISTALLIQEPNSQIQISRKSDPNKIGYLQPCGQPVRLAEGQRHPYNQRPKRDQPHKGKAEMLQIEKQDASEKIEDQLKPKKQQAPAANLRSGRQRDSGGPNAHQRKEDCPYDWKRYAGRRQRRLRYRRFVDCGAVSGQPSRESAHRFCT